MRPGRKIYIIPEYKGPCKTRHRIRTQNWTISLLNIYEFLKTC